jgi:predicted RNA-binding Zn ribbon-like protein
MKRSPQPGTTGARETGKVEGVSLISCDRISQAFAALENGEFDAPCAERALRQAITLRETVYGIFAAAARGKSPAPVDLAELNRVLRTQTLGAQIAGTPHGYRWVWKVREDAFDFLLGTVALSAADLLLSQGRSRVGQCADEDGCGWLFLNTSKNHSRRWCDVRDCGNRARQRQFQKRARRKAS